MIHDTSDSEFTIPGRMNSSEDDSDERVEGHAAIYARTSSYNQQFGYSTDEQIRRCWNEAETKGWSVRFVFVDEAKSGTNTDREDFQKLLTVAENGLIDVVVFWSLDRLCRSLADLVKTEEKLDEWGVAIRSVTEVIDTTSPVGRFNLRNIASAAELESDLTSQRVKIGMHGLAQEKKWPNATPPLGYKKTDDGTLEIAPEEADLVRRIFRLYVEERSMPQVAYLLNEDGISTRNGEEWCRQSVRKILANEIYAGNYQVAGVQDIVEEYRIVSDELFERVTEIRFRFQKTAMEEDRKQSKADRILEQYKNSVEVDRDDD